MSTMNKSRRILLYFASALALVAVLGLAAGGVSAMRLPGASGAQATQAHKSAQSPKAPTSNTYCVKADGSATGAPCTNANAFTNIQAAVALAVAGDEVRVAYGSFTGSGSAVVTVNTGITIIGGYPGGTTGWVASTDSVNTIIDGQGVRNALAVTGVTVNVHNLTLSNGGISNGGTVGVQSGYTLNLSNAGTSNGSFSIAGTLAFTAGSNTLAPGTTLTGAGLANLANGTLTINGTVSAQNFNQSAGVLTGSGTLAVGGVYNWFSGIMDSPGSPSIGSTTILAGAVLHINGTSTAKFLYQRTLNINTGATAYLDGTGAGVLGLGNSATVNNNGTIYAQNDDDIQYQVGTAPTFNNAGTFNKVGGADITTLGTGFVLLSNSGTIVAHSGTLSMDSQSNDTGVYSATVGAKIRFGGNNHTLAPGSRVEVAGAIEFSAGTTYVQGAYNVTGNTLMTGGTVVFGGPVFLDTLTVGPNPNSVVTLGGSGSVLNVRVLNWTAGTIIGGPTPNDRGTINVSGSITFGGVLSAKYLWRCTINNNGTAVMNTTGTGIFLMGDAAYFDNRPGAVFDIQGDDDIRYAGGVLSTFNNSPGATLRKSQGNPNLDSILGDGFLQFNNGGSVDVQVGTLSLQYSGSTPPSVDTGSFAVASGARLQFYGPSSTRTLPAGSSITGAGTIEFAAGTVSIAGTYNVTGSTDVTGNGIAQFNTNAVTNAGVLSVNGTLTGDAPYTFRINANFYWRSGTMGGTGTTIVSPSAQLHLEGVNGAKFLASRTLNNDGTTYVDGTGSGILYLSSGATFNNGSPSNSSAQFKIQNNDSVLYYTGVNSTFNNYAHLWKELGAGTSTLSSGNLQFNNYSDVRVITGTLSLDGGNTNGLNSTGAFTVETQSNLRFNGGSHTLVASSFITGAGSVEFSAGTVSMAGRYNIGGTTRILGSGTAQFNANSTSYATLLAANGTLSGDAIFTTTTRLDWTGGTMSGTGITAIPSGAELHLSGVNALKTLSNRTINNNGRAYVDGTGTGFLFMGNGATFNNNNRFDIQNDDDIVYSGGTNSSFNNNGILERTIGAQTAILGNGNLQFNNSGTVNIYTGTISLDSTGAIPSVDNGAYNVESVAALQFNGAGGTRNLQVGSSIVATGTVIFSAGTVNISGTYRATGSGTTNITGGIVAFNSNANAINVNLSLGTLTGSGIFTATSTFNWTGGTMDSPSTTVGATNIISTCVLNIAGTNATKILLQRTLNNNGTALVNGTGNGTGVLYMGNGAHFNNNASLNIQNNDNILYLSGANSVFTNNGTFGKSAGNGTSIVGNGNLFFNNNGTVDVLAGVINFSQNFVQTASGNSQTRLLGGDLTTNGNLTFQGGTLQGTGAITGTVVNTGATVNPDTSTGGAAGNIIFNGTYTQGSAGAVHVDIGGLTPGIDFDKINFLNSPTLSGTLSISLTNDYSPNVGNRFVILNYPAHNGTFTTINGANIGGGRTFQGDAGPTTSTAYTLTVQLGGPTSTPTPPPAGSPTPTYTPIPGCGHFSDVYPNDFFYEPVRYLNCAGVISGYADGTFRPYNLTTRGQLSKIVVLAEGWPLLNPPTPTFRDVLPGSPFYTHIETAYNHNIISGYSCGTGCLEFRPGNNVTRAQLSKIIVSAEGWTLIRPPQPTFRDVPDTDPFYEFIETASSHGIISGYGCGTGCLEFRPGNNATRGQICKIVYLAVTGP